MTVQTNTSQLQKGFTLIELLVVMGILAILLSLVLIAINPAKQFEQANNTKRSADVNAILNAIQQYEIYNKGRLPGASTNQITTSTKEISSTGANICSDLRPRFIASIPTDPTSLTNGAPVTACDTYDTDYTVVMSATDDRITVAAPNALPAIIQVTR